jgi:hypothetical protein
LWKENIGSQLRHKGFESSLLGYGQFWVFRPFLPRFLPSLSCRMTWGSHVKHLPKDSWKMDLDIFLTYYMICDVITSSRGPNASPINLFLTFCSWTWCFFNPSLKWINNFNFQFFYYLQNCSGKKSVIGLAAAILLYMRILLLLWISLASFTNCVDKILTFFAPLNNPIRWQCLTYQS